MPTVKAVTPLGPFLGPQRHDEAASDKHPAVGGKSEGRNAITPRTVGLPPTRLCIRGSATEQVPL
jgi:hypothetical protein